MVKAGLLEPQSYRFTGLTIVIWRVVKRFSRRGLPLAGKKDEQGTYVRTRVERKLRDRLSTVRCMVTEYPQYSNDWSNVQYMGKGYREANLEEGYVSWRAECIERCPFGSVVGGQKRATARTDYKPARVVGGSNPLSPVEKLLNFIKFRSFLHFIHQSYTL